MHRGTWRQKTLAVTATAATLCGVALAGAAVAGAETGSLINGGFEDPAIAPNAFRTYQAGDSFGDWTVVSGSVDVIRTQLYASAEGQQALDLNGEAPGTIAQVVQTVPKTKYLVRFALAGDPTTQGEVSGRLLANGKQVRTFTFDTTGHTWQDMGYRTVQASFVAKGTTTKLTFAGVAPTGAYGAFIDDVRVEPR